MLSCSSCTTPSSAAKSARQLSRFVETGDTVLIQNVFSDSVLQLMSIGEMYFTRNDFANRFGQLQQIDGPDFSTDSTAQLLLKYESMNLQASLEFDDQGRIRFLSIEPEPIRQSGEGIVDANAAIDIDLAAFKSIFNNDSNHVRLVTLLSPT